LPSFRHCPGTQAKLRLAWNYRTTKAESKAPVSWAVAQGQAKEPSIRTIAPVPATPEGSKHNKLFINIYLFFIF